MDAFKQLIQICGLIQSMNNFRNNLALRLHAMQPGYVEETCDQAFYSRIAQAIGNRRLNPAPLSRLAPQAAATFSSTFRNFSESAKTIPHFTRIIRVQEICQRSPNEFVWPPAEDARGSRAGMKDNSVWTENGQQLPGAIEQCSKLLWAGYYAWLKRRAL
jgi:hypothetical protein